MINLILDMDTGVDDSIALTYAVLNHDINLLGVVGTYGNVTTELGVQNDLKILSLLGSDNVPVYRGRAHSLGTTSFSPHSVSVQIHGDNGLGNQDFPVSSRLPKEEDGVDFLIESMRKYEENLVIVTTGPLTNLASVLIKEPDLALWKGRVVAMGGALTVRGNVSHFAEANISQDPEAAKIVFESGLDITMVGLDVTMRSRLSKKDSENWRNTGSSLGLLYADMLDYYIANTTGGEDTYVHDPSAVICAVHPEYFTTLEAPLTVELEGIDRGRVIVDSARIRELKPCTKAAINVDCKKVEAELQIISRYMLGVL